MALSQVSPLRKQPTQSCARLLLRIKQRELSIRAPSIVPRTSGARQHAMTRNEQRDRIRTDRRTNGAARLGPIQLGGDLPVAGALPKRDFHQRPPDRFLKVRALGCEITPTLRRFQPFKSVQPLQKCLAKHTVRTNVGRLIIVKNKLRQAGLGEVNPHPAELGKEITAPFSRQSVRH